MPRLGPHNGHLFRYSELFFGLNPQDFPNLAGLHALRWNESDVLLADDARSVVDKELSPIHRLCRQARCEPLLSEFALITETRAIGPKAKPYFSSFISMFLEPTLAISAAYGEALRAMASPALGDGTQIVPHPELYAFDTGFIDIDCASITSAEKADRPLSIPEHPIGIAGLRQEFHEGREASALFDRVHTFLNRFLDNVRGNPELSGIAPTLATSRFMLLPFVRPAFESAALSLSEEASRPAWRGYPGGAIFLFVRPKSASFNPLPLARTLSWLLAESSVRESFGELQAEENRRRAFVSYSITHPLKHRLGAVHADGEQLRESYDTGSSDFPARLDVHQQLIGTVYGFAELCHTLHYAAVHGSADTLAAPDAGGRLKFATARSLDVVKLLREVASTLVLGRKVSERVQLQLAPALSLSLEGFFWVDAVNDKVRLNNELYREIFCELLSNAARHGSPDAAGAVAVKVTVELLDAQLGIVLTNTLPEARASAQLHGVEPEWKERYSESPTGLTFVADILRLTGAGRLFTRHRQVGLPHERQFAAALLLKGLRVDEEMVQIS